jgi:hypothetical protein
VARQRGCASSCIALRNSGDTAGDKARVVGYAAFALYEPEAAMPRMSVRPCWCVARNAIAARLGQPDAARTGAPGTDQTRRDLRHADTEWKLARLHRLAAGASPAGPGRACQCRRRGLQRSALPAAGADELARTRVEVSLLTAPQPMTFSDEADALRQLRPGMSTA